MIIKLQITDWGQCLGGEHFTGKLMFNKNNELEIIEVKQIMSVKMALYLNKKSGSRSYSLYEPGKPTINFDKKEQLIRAAIKIVKREFPHSLLLEGDYACASVEKPLYWPSWFDKEAKEILSLFEEMNKVGWYEGNYEKAKRIDSEFQKIIKSFKAIKK